MKHRFVVTLLAVAIASLSAQAFAIAPMISDFRSPIIADDKPVTDSNNFFYEDVFNLDQKGHDPDLTVTDDHLIWSFMESSGTYRVNGRQSMNLGTDDPNAPGTKEVGKAGLDDVDSADSNPRTITFRNQALSPATSPGATFPTDPTPHFGLLPAQTKMLTLFASDGTSFSQKSFLVYTFNGGLDSLSGKGLENIVPQTTPLSTGASSWTSQAVLGTINFSASGATTGLCIDVPAAGDNFAGWISPYGIVQLVKNRVYRFRLEVSTTAAVADGATPFWDFLLDNVPNASDTSVVVEQKYSSDLLVWDNNGSANSAGRVSGGRRQFDMYWAPLPVQQANWNDATSGEFATAHDAANDARFQFRVLDVNGVVDGNNDAGTVCLNAYTIDGIDIGDISTSGNVYDNTSLVDAAGTPAANRTHVSFIGISGATTTTYSGGVATITPTVVGGATTPAATATPNPIGSWDLEIVTLDVGDANIDFGNLSTVTDNWPIPWVSDQLLMVTAGIQAIDAAAEANPPDALQIVVDSATSEIAQGNTVLAGSNTIGLPKAASVTTYTSFVYTQNKTNNASTQLQGLRPNVGLLFQRGILSGGINVNNGGVKVSFLKVDTVDTSGF